MAKKKNEFVGRSKQLAKDERETLANHLTTRALKKEKTALDKRETELVDMALEQFLGPYQKQLSELPEEWTCKIEPGKTTIKLDSNQSCYRDIIFAHSSIEMIDLDGKRTIPYLSNENPSHKKLINLLEKHLTIKHKLEEKESQLNSKTLGALSAINTSKQLFEKWPEAYQEYVKLYPAEEMLLPDIPREQLNKELGL